MTVARLNTHPTYHRPHGLEGAVYRLGMALVAWAHGRTRTEDQERTARTRAAIRDTEEARHQADLARAGLARGF